MSEENTIFGLLDELDSAIDCVNEGQYDDFYSLYEKLSSLPDITLESNQNRFIDECNRIIEKCNDTIVKLYVYSFKIGIIKTRKEFYEFIEWITLAEYSYEIKYYILIQIKALMFLYPKQLAGIHGIVLATRLLQDIVERIKLVIPKELLEPLPKETLNNNFVMTISQQVLGTQHGPTKHALDHCVTIMRALGKQVLLVNTAEYGKGCISIPFFRGMRGNYMEGYNSVEYLEWDGYKVPFVQCSNDMPNTEEIILLLNTIRKYKPCMILEISSSSLVASLAESIVPVLTNGTLHSSVEISVTKYQTMARQMDDIEREEMTKLERDDSHIINSMFSSKVRPKTENITREQLGVPEDAFCVAIVGGRLGQDVSEKLIDLLIQTLNDNTYYIFFGNFDTYEKLIEKYKTYRKFFINYGFTKDTVACLEQCDLFFNPYRAGGGMSAIEAMAVGIPAVSTSYGDAGVILGADFWVNSEEDYPKEITRYRDDKEYYQKKANIAYNRGQYLQNSDEVFVDTIKEFYKRIEADS